MIFKAIVARELRLALRNLGEIFQPLWFYLIIITLFPLVVGTDPNLLQKIATGITWIAVLLSAITAFERLFRDDFLDGSLEQLAILPQPLVITCGAKIFAHWLITALPLILLSPLTAILLNLNFPVWKALVATLLLGTPVLSALGAVGVALTVSLRKSGTLLSLLILPLFTPVLIFSAATLEASRLALPYNGQLAILGALCAGTLTITPWAVNFALKASLE